MTKVHIRKSHIPKAFPQYFLWHGPVETFLARLSKHYPDKRIFDLLITSPPYNIGKEYESSLSMDRYIAWQREIIGNILPFIKETGHLCWQVGCKVKNNELIPLDALYIPIFKEYGLTLRNRIIWTFGHGLHETRRFSGRYETLLWYTLSDNYTFNLDGVRIPQKYPGKKAYKGPNKGNYSGNPLGKNPSDVWEIPNVKGRHIEKTEHPCQFPVGLVERCLRAFTNEGDTVFDPFAGVGSSGVAAALLNRQYIGCEIRESYMREASRRITSSLAGNVRYRPHDKPIYDYAKSSLSKKPDELALNEPRQEQS